MCVVSNLFYHRSLHAPEGPVADPGRRQGKGLKETVLGTCPGKCNRETSQYTVSQSHERVEMEEVQDGWIQYEHSPRAMQLREYTQKEFGEFFVDDRPFGTDSKQNREVLVQSNAVLSYAITLMVKIRGWEDEESWVGSKFAACMWIYTKEALTGGQILDRVQEEYPRKRIMSIVLCKNWVFAGAFADHEWVSSWTTFQQEEETLSMALAFKIDVPCVVQWREPVVVLCAHELESQLWK